MMPANVGERLIRKFESRIHRDSETGCWLWTGATNSWGYGYINAHRKPVGAHRVSYELYRGEIEAGKQLDHLCRTRNCVNPDHLEQVTIKENLLRGEGWSGINSRKTHCKHGHEFTEANTGIRPGGGRTCRTCKREEARLIRARRRAA